MMTQIVVLLTILLGAANAASVLLIPVISAATMIQIWFEGWEPMAKYTRIDVSELAKVMRDESDRGRPFALITGAGCSIGAGIPLAPGILERIPDHLKQSIYAKLGVKQFEAQHYGRTMGGLTLQERQDILDPLLKNAKVNWGHLALAGLMKGNMVGRVLTFNFDSVLARACGICGLYPAIYDFAVSPAQTFDHIVTPSIIHLHGQRYGLAMIHSDKETREHAKKLRALFRDTFDRFNVLIIGYSGEADQAFPHIVKSASNKHRLYWCGFSDGEPPDHVRKLLRAAGTTACAFAGVEFDRYMVELAQELKEPLNNCSF